MFIIILLDIFITAPIYFLFFDIFWYIIGISLVRIDEKIKNVENFVETVDKPIVCLSCILI